ncbi:MAG: IS200/IS605 family transposase [candidate division KSB1 bacterium]|nr:IS200/IS605 family transposase [candidate division KSB1 bacterium]MDZ7302156.1 IS200/IS605 family transposase [candidate division KSB1 bacterium]MDZ7311266.1 IS200/IS605 family transposase [candidate division KSB1 bacterium]
MSEIFHELVFHFVFATKDRTPSLMPSIQRLLYSHLRQVCKELPCELHEIGGTEDHLHLLLSLRPSQRIDVVADTLKAAGAEMINKLALGKTLEWEEGYGVLSLRNKDIEIVAEYIRTQPERHRKGDLIGKMERTK